MGVGTACLGGPDEPRLSFDPAHCESRHESLTRQFMTRHERDRQEKSGTRQGDDQRHAGTAYRRRCRETCANFGRGFMNVLY